MALLIVFLTIGPVMLQNPPRAWAAAINPVDAGTLRINRVLGSWGTIHVGDELEVTAAWAVEDGSAQPGDAVTITFPTGFEGIPSSIDMLDNDESLGTCLTSQKHVVCTLGEAVNGKNSVEGRLSFFIKPTAPHTGSAITLTINENTAVDVALPRAQGRIDYDTSLPTSPSKEGAFTGDPIDGIRWRVVVPGASMRDRSTLKISDQFRMPGTTFDVKAGEVSFYRFRNTPQCWYEKNSPACGDTIYTWVGASTESAGGVDLTVDDTADRVDLTYDNGTAFTDDDVYVLEIGLGVREKILLGSIFVNNAEVNDQDKPVAYLRNGPPGITRYDSQVGSIKIIKIFNDEDFEPLPVSLPAGPSTPAAPDAPGGTGDSASRETDTSQEPEPALPPDTVFSVRYRYTYEGQERSGILGLSAPAWEAYLYNIPVGSVVTLTEASTEVPGRELGDPVFSGEYVADGVPDDRSAQVTIAEPYQNEILLKNPILTRLAPVDVTAGACTPGVTEPSEPAVTVGTTEGIHYSEPEIVTAGDQVTVTVRASRIPPYTIDDTNLPEGWVAQPEGEYVFTRTLTQPDCTHPAPAPSPSMTPSPTSSPSPSASPDPSPSPSQSVPASPSPGSPSPTPPVATLTPSMPRPASPVPVPPSPKRPTATTPVQPVPVRPGLPRTGS